MEIIDITKTNLYNTTWVRCLNFIENNCQADPLYENYIGIDTQDFVSLPVVIIDDTIVAFSGAQYKPDVWGHNIPSVSSRFWIHPDYRHSCSKFETSDKPWYNSEFLISQQIKEINRLGIPHMFISREGDYKNSFQKYINLVNRYNNTDFRLVEDLYLIQCIPQIIAVHSTHNIDQILREETLLKKIDNL